MAILVSKLSSEATRGPNCSQKGHLGILGWSGIGFRVILGSLWTTLWDVNFQVFRQAAELELLFLWTFVVCFLGMFFGRFCTHVLMHGDLKSKQNHRSVVQNQGFTKIKEVIMLLDANNVKILGHCGGGFG